MNKQFRKVGSKVVAGVALAAGAVGSAMAALPADVATATTAAKADITEAGGLILGVVIAVAAVGWLRRVIR